MTSSLDNLPEYDEYLKDGFAIKKYLIKKPKIKKNKDIPHFIIVGHGMIREGQTFINRFNCKIQYYCTRGNVMLGYINNREYLIEQLENMCNKKIIEKNIYEYGDEIDNAEYLALNDNESRLMGIYTCDNLDTPLHNLLVNRIYTLEELLIYINNYSNQIYNSKSFLVSILGCRPIDEKPYIIPKHIYGEKLTGTKRKRGQYGGKKKTRKKKKSIKRRKYKYSKRKYR